MDCWILFLFLGEGMKGHQDGNPFEIYRWSLDTYRTLGNMLHTPCWYHRLSRPPSRSLYSERFIIPTYICLICDGHRMQTNTHTLLEL